MKIAIIGAGAAGVMAAISIKRQNPNYNVVIFEHLDKPLKKILATGNGKCNLGNSKLDLNKYKNSEFVKNVFSNYTYKKYKELIESIGFLTKENNNLLYPQSESAITVREAFLKQLNSLKIEIKLNEELLDYKSEKQILIKTNLGEYYFDKLIITTGGCSNPKLGSDGSIFSILKSHNYQLVETKPGLCPIYVKEKTKILDGIRVTANVKIDENFSELGEVLFKEKGLSGIVIFNASSEIAKLNKNSVKICLDLLPNYDFKQLKNLRKSPSNTEFLDSLIHPNLVKYFIQNGYDKDPIKYLKNLPFTFDKFYGFEFSQVSVGGLSIKEINNNFQSKREKNVYFLGEVLDVDGPCGGYNLTWAFYTSSLIRI